MDVHELTAAYALDALDADDARAYEAHLSQCEACREELALLSESATALAWAVDAPMPPAALRERILDAAAAERTNVVPLRRPWVFRATAAAAAVAACVAVGLGIWASSLLDSVHQARASRVADARAVEILADPASRHLHVAGASGMVAVDATGQAALLLKRLPAAPSGKTYEAWIMTPGSAPQRAGTFRGGGPTTVVRLDRPLPKGSRVGATIERAGGVDAPTQAPVFSAQA